MINLSAINLVTIIIFIIIIILIILHNSVKKSIKTKKKIVTERVLTPSYWYVDGEVDYRAPHKKYHAKYSPHHFYHHHPHHYNSHHPNKNKGPESESKYIHQLHKHTVQSNKNNRHNNYLQGQDN